MEPARHYSHALHLLSGDPKANVAFFKPSRSGLDLRCIDSNTSLVLGILQMDLKGECPLRVCRTGAILKPEDSNQFLYVFDQSEFVDKETRRFRLTPEDLKALDIRIGLKMLDVFRFEMEGDGKHVEVAASVEEVASNALVNALTIIEGNQSEAVVQARQILTEMLQDVRSRKTGAHLSERQATLAYVSKDPGTLKPGVPQLVATLLEAQLKGVESLHVSVKFYGNTGNSLTKSYYADLKPEFTQFVITDTQAELKDAHQLLFNSAALKRKYCYDHSVEDFMVFDDKETAQRFLALMREKLAPDAVLTERGEGQEIRYLVYF